MLHKTVQALDRDLASFFGLPIDEHKLVRKPHERWQVHVDAPRGGTGIIYERLRRPMTFSHPFERCRPGTGDVGVECRGFGCG